MLFSNMATRKREYGMLQCVGLTDKQLSSIVVKEGSYIPLVRFQFL